MIQIYNILFNLWSKVSKLTICHHNQFGTLIDAKQQWIKILHSTNTLAMQFHLHYWYWCQYGLCIGQIHYLFIISISLVSCPNRLRGFKVFYSCLLSILQKISITSLTILSQSSCWLFFYITSIRRLQVKSLFWVGSLQELEFGYLQPIKGPITLVWVVWFTVLLPFYLPPEHCANTCLCKHSLFS